MKDTKTIDFPIQIDPRGFPKNLRKRKQNLFEKQLKKKSSTLRN